MKQPTPVSNKKTKQKPDYHTEFMMCSSGTIDADMRPHTGAKFSAEEMLGMKADALARITLAMERKGYIRFMSPSEIEKTYGGYRQHWERLLREGRIRFIETSAGRMTIDLWIEQYLQNKEEIDKYCRMKNKVIKEIMERKERSCILMCPKCGERQLDCIYNILIKPKKGEVYNTNGVCRNHGCTFKFYELIQA